MYGVTLVETHHGNWGEKRVLPANIHVKLMTATNLPLFAERDDTQRRPRAIAYWASPCDGHAWPKETAEWAETVGVGLYESDVKVDGMP